MSVEKTVAEHYGRSGLAERILVAAASLAAEKTGRGGGHLAARELAPVDEFHIGGIEATERFLPKLDPKHGTRWLDIGSGIGGACRYAAERFGCHVTGIDLTPEFCRTADVLTEKVDMAGKVSFHVGSALNMPFADCEFDGAFTLHVAMNIEDKPALYREVRRVLKPGTLFGIYDILAGPSGGALQFPVPWANTQDASFLASIADMKTMLDAVGFTMLSCEDRTDYARGFFEKLRLQAAAGGPPQFGLSLIMGEDFRAKVANMIRNVNEGRCGPWEIVCRRR
jgi:SAM-dependent methyltransferase